jgi:Fur family transcriptional regulator, ferric uptake regulator
MRTSSVDQIILSTLSREHCHLTSQAVYNEIRQRLPAVNPSTVYRALERLVHEGRVSISDMGLGAAVYELVTDHRHHHLVCQKCGQVTTLDDAAVQAFFGGLQRSHQFQVTTNHLILFGVCGPCQAGEGRGG